MGTRKRDSDQRLQLRISKLTEDDRETLHVCNACGGKGTREIPVPGEPGRYRQKRCVWCVGKGCVDHVVAAMFERWLRMRAAARCSTTP